jgi:O-antigen ligase
MSHCREGEAARRPCDAPALGWRVWWPALLAVVILSDALDGPMYALFGVRAVVLPGLPVSRAPLLYVFALAVVLISSDWRRAAAHARAAWLLWPAVALAFVSAMWSDQPGRTLAWAVALLGTSAFGVALAARFSPAAQSGLVAGAVSATAAGGIVVASLWPAAGIDYDGNWRGLFIERNLQGRVMALGVVGALVAALDERRRAAGLLAMLLCTVTLLATQSRASLLAAGIAVAALLILVAARAWPRRAAAILVTGTAAAGVFLAFLVATPRGLALLSRDPTLTRRTIVWQTVAGVAGETPWVGRGYGAFWPGAAGARVLEQVGFGVNQAHNGAVDVYAELGIVGLVVVLAPLAVFAFAAFRHALEPGAPACLWPAAYLVFFVASNAAESSLLRHKLYWALYVAAACHLGTCGAMKRH